MQWSFVNLSQLAIPSLHAVVLSPRWRWVSAPCHMRRRSSGPSTLFPSRQRTTRQARESGKKNFSSWAESSGSVRMETKRVLHHTTYRIVERHITASLERLENLDRGVGKSLTSDISVMVGKKARQGRFDWWEKSACLNHQPRK